MISTPSQNQACPCGTGVAASDCCSPVLQGRKQPGTAEELLRARYTAFTQGNVDFIIQSHHGRTREEINRQEVEEWSKGSEWLGLRIYEKEAGQAGDTQGTVTFCAQYRTRDGKSHDHWEQALFEKEDGQWRFLDARGVKLAPFKRNEPKVGRNDPCSCGSGKKSKKCCGA
jgi:SEC-C motif domain protein